MCNFCFRAHVASNIENCPCFGRHCSSHLQGECVESERFWKPCIEHAVGGELHPHKSHTFSLKVVTAVFAETSFNS